MQSNQGYTPTPAEITEAEAWYEELSPAERLRVKPVFFCTAEEIKSNRGQHLYWLRQRWQEEQQAAAEQLVSSPEQSSPAPESEVLPHTLDLREISTMHQPPTPPPPSNPHKYEIGERYWSSLTPGTPRYTFWFCTSLGFWDAIRYPGGVGYILHMLYYRSLIPAWHRFTSILALALFASLTYFYFFGSAGGTKP